MPSGRTDWLDRLARRAGESRVQTPRGVKRGADDVASPGDVAEDRFTRATSLKLAVLGAASLSLGLWKAPGGRAQSQSLGQCLADCVDGYNSTLRYELEACRKAFAPSTLAKKPSWRRFRRRLRVTPIGWKSVVDQLRSNCYAKAHDYNREGIKRCQKRCRALVQYTPPPKPTSPVVPPAPAAAAEGGFCSNCARGAPTAYCDSCPSAPEGSVCCYLPAVGGKSPCCV